jgi:hypothetical protein
MCRLALSAHHVVKIADMRYLVPGALFVFLIGCRIGGDRDARFLANYQDYCGYAYEGESSLVELGDDHPLENAELLMILQHCLEDEVRIPFHVNDDRSRTWVVRRVGDGRLHLSHDHRYPDGTEHVANMYGGYSDGEGDVHTVYFPADQATIAERPSREINRWAKSFDHSAQRYYYRLYLRDTLRYEAVFDLSRPLPVDSSD